MNDIYVRLLNLPHGVSGYVAEDPEGDYNVYLNSRLTHESNTEAYDHELRHISAGHFRQAGHVRDIESDM
jgi:hypothetical protein